MLDHKEVVGDPIDIAIAGGNTVVDVRTGDYGRGVAYRVSGVWTNGVIAVYGRVGEGKWIDTAERITAADPKTAVMDLIGWSELRFAVLTPDTGGGCELRVAVIVKGPR